MMWEFSLYKIGQLLLPHAKRKIGFIAWTGVYLGALAETLDRLRSHRAASLRDARMTPQICFLEKYLNDRFETSGIRIVDGKMLGPWCFYGGPPVDDVDFYAVEPDNYCYAANVATEIDFVVEVPHPIQSECGAIAAAVQKYKMAGKSFLIQIT